jgi:hypothetical protein
MKTKTFKSLNEWISSNPDEDTTQKILKLVNKGVMQSLKREFTQKKIEMKKIERTIDSMKLIGLPVTEAVEKRLIDIRKEIVELQKELPESVKKTKPNK